MERRTDPIPGDPPESEARWSCGYFAESTGERPASKTFRCQITGTYCSMEEGPDCRSCNFALAWMLTGNKPTRCGL